MNQINISFIIPVYNVEKYLSRCLESVINQNDIVKEIILINDGSTDNSLSICREYEDKFSYIKTIDKQNEGVSIARNTGLKLAKGEYVCFLDADDYYCENFAKEFYDICKMNNLDIIRGKYKIHDEEDNVILENLQINEYDGKVLSGKEFLKYSIDNNSNEVVPWLGFFKKNYLLDNHLYFPENIGYEEDQLFFLKCLLTKKINVMQTNKYFYMYVKRKGSCTTTPKISNIKDACYVTSEEIDFIASLNLEKNIKHTAYVYASWSFFQVTTLFGKLSKDEQNRVYSKIPYKVFKHAVKYPTSLKNKYKVLLLWKSPKIYSIIFRLIRN